MPVSSHICSLALTDVLKFIILWTIATGLDIFFWVIDTHVISDTAVTRRLIKRYTETEKETDRGRERC